MQSSIVRCIAVLQRIHPLEVKSDFDLTFEVDFLVLKFRQNQDPGKIVSVPVYNIKIYFKLMHY